jgi:hypothetical protein
MTLRPISIAALLLGTLALTGCKATEDPVSAAGDAPAASAGPTDSTTTGSTSTTSDATPSASRTTSKKPGTTTKKTTTPTTSTSTASGPHIVSFKIVQKPKCAEGTAVFRAKPVPLIIKWTITGADSAALSVDDATHTAGTYGPEGLTGTETFDFTCAGAIGTVETHTYAIYTVGGGTQHSKTLKASAKVLDKGPNTPN